MFIWNEKKHAVDCQGALLLTQPETGIRWKNEAEALRWWQTSEFNPESQVALTAQATATRDNRIAVKITDISAVIRKPANVNQRELINIAAEEGKNIVLSGELAIDDEDFVVPFRRDDGRTIYFPIAVKNGLFSATLNFPTSGRYQIDSQSINAEFSTPRFKTKTLVVFVLRAGEKTETTSVPKSLINSVLGK